MGAILCGMEDEHRRSSRGKAGSREGGVGAGVLSLRRRPSEVAMWNFSPARSMLKASGSRWEGRRVRRRATSGDVHGQGCTAGNRRPRIRPLGRQMRLLTQNLYPAPSTQQAEQAGFTREEIPKRASQFSLKINKRQSS
jgi:hypothetical protein